MSAIEQHIKNTFGEFENVFHELVSPDIHVDICMVPPSEERDYYTLVTMGMGAHQMNVPEELAEYKLERAELAIALPKDWKLDEESGVPEVYTEEDMEAIERHIQQYFGKFENVFHELSSPDIHVDICVVPP